MLRWIPLLKIQQVTLFPFKNGVKMNNIHEVFENQVEKTPYVTAIIDDYTSITYQELNEKANQLAHYLRSLGIKPDMKIALCFERSFDMFIAVLAILKAGAAYVPLDNSHPEERLLFCLNDNDNPILILSINCQEKFKAYAGHCLYLDIEREIIAISKIKFAEKSTRFPGS